MAREHAGSMFRQGNINRDTFWCLEERLAMCPPNMPHHGNDSKPHTWTVEEGETMSVLFGILLEDFRTSKIIDRVQPGVGGDVPAP